MRKIVAPLALLASITLLTSCTEKQATVPAVPAVKTETPAPVEVVTPVVPVAPVATGTAATPVTATPTVRTRTETVTYASPANPQDPVEFSVTVTDGVITAASATSKSDNPISQKWQTGFAGQIASVAVGKKAKDLDLDAVGGASLTTGAFEIFARSFN
jgi:hypothetical protein